MAEAPVGVLEERHGSGQEVYVKSMELSSDAKAKEILPWVRPGIIVDAGAGSGPLTERLSRELPDSKIIAADISKDMVERMTSRFKGNKKIEVIRADVKDFHYPEPVDTMIFSSNLHEVFSFGGYNHKEVIKTLENARNMLKDGGRIIIRDGVQPVPEQLYIKPLNEFACDRFSKFVNGFSKVRNVNFMIGNFKSGVFAQSGRRDFNDGDIGKSYIEISSQNASEMFSKYFYSEQNLPVELSEQFGIWTLEEYKKILSGIGFTIKHSETFLLDYLLKEHYSKDFEVFHLKDGVLSNAPYPPSTMLLVGEKS